MAATMDSALSCNPSARKRSSGCPAWRRHTGVVRNRKCGKARADIVQRLRPGLAGLHRRRHSRWRSRPYDDEIAHPSYFFRPACSNTLLPVLPLDRTSRQPSAWSRARTSLIFTIFALTSSPHVPAFGSRPAAIDVIRDRRGSAPYWILPAPSHWRCFLSAARSR